MLSFKEFMSVNRLIENKNKDTAVFTFGRFNPMTCGHEKVINLVIDESIKNNADPLVFPSFTRDSKRNPLYPRKKMFYLDKIFERATIINDDTLKNHFFVIKRLSEAGYKRIIMIAGSDRVERFEGSVNEYINHKNPAVRLNIESFKVINAGDREGEISASYMREYAKKDDWDSFRKGLPSNVNEPMAKDIFEDVKLGLKTK